MNTAETELFDERTSFVIELARRLHLAGVTASHLEGAIRATANALGLICEIWSAPTGLLLSLSYQGEGAVPQVTRVLRLEPSDINLSALVALDDIADRVIAGELNASEGLRRMRALDAPVGAVAHYRVIGAFGLAAAAVAALLRTGWMDIGVAGALGLLIGWVVREARARSHVAPALEAVAAFVATLVAILFARYVAPISVQTVVIAALIILMPGLTLTTSVAELAAQQLVTGTTRFAGAIVTLLKLIFGSVAASQLTAALGIIPRSPVTVALPPAVEYFALAASSFALATLFRAQKRDVLLVMSCATLGYLLTRAGTLLFESGTGPAFAGAVFLSSMTIAALANLYGRVAQRPAALIRVPGIMLLVPGSVSFRTLSSVMGRDYVLGMDAGVAVLSALVALMAGLLFGSVLVPPRRYL